MDNATSLVAKSVGTLCFIGYVPFAPGTAASLATLLLIGVAQPSLPVHVCALALTIGAGIWSAGMIERTTGKKDNRIIVIDEAAGCLVSLLFLPMTPLYLVVAFSLFRVFDILKPPPIRWIEKTIAGGAGVMLDDVAAGIFTNLILQAFHALRI